MPPVEPNDEARQEEQTNDVATPFQPADDTSPAPAADDTHPNSDTDVDSDEQYQEGTTAATGAPAPPDPSTELEDVSEVPSETTASEDAADADTKAL